MNIPAVKSAVSGRLSPQATQQLMALAALVILYWIVLGVVEGLNPWKDEDHARTQEVPR